MLRQPGRFLRMAWEQLEEVREPLLVPSEVGRKLPEDRPQFFPKREDARGQEVCERRLDIPQFFHVCDETRSLDAEYESGRRFRVPALITRRSLERVKRPIDLDRIKGMARKFELLPVGELFRIKNAAPAGIGPTGDSDVQVVRPPPVASGDQIISRESCHKILYFSQSFRNIESPSFSSGP